MSFEIIRPKSREEWLKYRTVGIGSSEVATIVGLNPYETPYQLWRRKTGRDPIKEETFAMKAGHYLEDAVAKFWADATGRTIIKNSGADFLIRSTEKPFLQVSPDRTYWLTDRQGGNAPKGILECKTTQREIDPNDLPKYWFAQVQYQLGTAEIEQGSIAWLTAGRNFGYQDLAFRPDFYKWLCEEAEQFWVENIIEDKEPEATTAADVITKFAQHTAGKITEVTEREWEIYQQLKAVREKITELTAEKEALEDALKLVFADAEAITYQGETLATWRTAKPSQKFDEKAFKKACPNAWEDFLIEVQGSRRFLVK